MRPHLPRCPINNVQTFGDAQSAGAWRVFVDVTPALLADVLRRRLSQPWIEFVGQADLTDPQLPPVDVALLDALAAAPARADVTIRLACAGTTLGTVTDALPLVIVNSMEELSSIFDRLCPRRPTGNAHVDYIPGGGGA